MSSIGTGIGGLKGDKENAQSIKLKQHSLLPMGDCKVFEKPQYKDSRDILVQDRGRLETIFTDNFRDVQFSPSSSCASNNSNSMRNAYQSHTDGDGLSTPSECNQFQSDFAQRFFQQAKKERIADEGYMRMVHNDYSEHKIAMNESDSESY